MVIKVKNLTIIIGDPSVVPLKTKLGEYLNSPHNRPMVTNRTAQTIACGTSSFLIGGSSIVALIKIKPSIVNM